MTKGIVIVAAKEPYYGRMAYNLALTIKAVEPDIPVAVLHNGRGLSHLSEKQKDIFNERVELPEEIGGIEAKLHVYNYGPFDQTLYIDADNAWMPKRKPSDLLRELDGISFTAITEGKYEPETGVNELNPNYTVWGDIGEIVKAYGIEYTFYQYRTEVMYFEKGETAVHLFNDALEVTRSPKTNVQQFADTVPDEYALNIMAAYFGIAPHRYKWQPAYWQALHGGRMDRTRIMQDYWILSTGGNGYNTNTGRFYTDLVQSAANKLRVQRFFPLLPKRNSMKERIIY